MRDIGLTGADFVAAAQSLNQTAENTLRAGFQFGTSTISSTNNLVAGATSQLVSLQEDQLNTLRDFSQRAIAAGTGQATPLQEIKDAGSNEIPVWVWVVGAILLLLLLTRK